MYISDGRDASLKTLSPLRGRGLGEGVVQRLDLKGVMLNFSEDSVVVERENVWAFTLPVWKSQQTRGIIHP